MSLSYSTGNGGRYSYFFCLGRHAGRVDCHKALQVDAVEAELERYWLGVKVAESAKIGIRRVLAEELDEEGAEAESERRVLQRRVQTLGDERQKLLDGYYAGAIPVDLLKSEQDRIGRGTSEAESRLGKLRVKFERIEGVITRAMVWVDSLHLAYQAADEQVRRLLNHALFTHIFLKADGSVERVEYTEGIGDLLVEGGVGMAEQGSVRRKAGVKVSSSARLNVGGMTGVRRRNAGRTTGGLVITVGTSSVWWR